MRILECSTAGDRRFSAFNASLIVDGRVTTIEEAYQLSKIFREGRPNSIWDCKGKNARFKGCEVVSVEVLGRVLPARFLTQWYYLLWYTYLRGNPNLVEYAKEFDDYTDRFRGRSVNCQADAIRMYVKEGPSAVLSFCFELLDVLIDEVKSH